MDGSVENGDEPTGLHLELRSQWDAFSPMPVHPPSRAALGRVLGAVVFTAALALVVASPGSAGDGADADAEGTTTTSDSPSELTPAKALVLGVVEGVTEYLPISSTGHLYVTGQLLGVGTTEETSEAADAYVIAIQSGAILAVLVLYHHRIRSMLAGLAGRDPAGRRVAIGVMAAFLPAAAAGLLLEDAIKGVLFGFWPIIAAWAVGGVAVIWVSHRYLDRAAEEAERADPTPDDPFDPAEELETDRGGLALLSLRQSFIIGAAQCLALWPGTSRSLVTIVAAVLVGLSLPAAVEFSFLLGLATLGAATAYEITKSGGEIVDTFGVTGPLIGFAAAFVSAVVAVRWMVGYLQRHSFAIFGWYRLVVAGVAAGLVLGGVVDA